MRLEGKGGGIVFFLEVRTDDNSLLQAQLQMTYGSIGRPDEVLGGAAHMWDVRVWADQPRPDV